MTKQIITITGTLETAPVNDVPDESTDPVVNPTPQPTPQPDPQPDPSEPIEEPDPSEPSPVYDFAGERFHWPSSGPDHCLKWDAEHFALVGGAVVHVRLDGTRHKLMGGHLRPSMRHIERLADGRFLFDNGTQAVASHTIGPIDFTPGSDPAAWAQVSLHDANAESLDVRTVMAYTHAQVSELPGGTLFAGSRIAYNSGRFGARAVEGLVPAFAFVDPADGSAVLVDLPGHSIPQFGGGGVVIGDWLYMINGDYTSGFGSPLGKGSCRVRWGEWQSYADDNSAAIMAVHKLVGQLVAEESKPREDQDPAEIARLKAAVDAADEALRPAREAMAEHIEVMAQYDTIGMGGGVRKTHIEHRPPNYTETLWSHLPDGPVGYMGLGGSADQKATIIGETIIKAGRLPGRTWYESGATHEADLMHCFWFGDLREWEDMTVEPHRKRGRWFGYRNDDLLPEGCLPVCTCFDGEHLYVVTTKPGTDWLRFVMKFAVKW